MFTSDAEGAPHMPSRIKAAALKRAALPFARLLAASGSSLPGRPSDGSGRTALAGTALAGTALAGTAWSDESDRIRDSRAGPATRRHNAAARRQPGAGLGLLA